MPTCIKNAQAKPTEDGSEGEKIINSDSAISRIVSVHNWRWSETTKNYVGPPEYSYPVVLWTTKISSPNQNCDMPQRYLNNCRHSRVIIPETLYPLSPFWQNKTRVGNHEGHKLLTLRSIIIHAFCGFTKLLMWKHIASVKKITVVVTLVVVRTTKTRLHKSRSSRDELEFDLSNFV